MLILILAIVALGVFAAAYSLIAGRKNGGSVDDKVTIVQTCATCDGSPSTKCEQDCMMEAATKDIEYYDDEELDRFKGRQSDSYTDNEVEMFSDVLYTMRQNEVAGWCRSLNLRGIQLPDQLKDETFMLIEN